MAESLAPSGVTQRQAVQAVHALLGGSDADVVSAARSLAPKRRPGDPGDPWLSGAGRFLLEVDGVPIGRFTEAQGLNVEIGVEKIEEGGQNHFVHQRPGRMTWPNITLKRGIVDDDNLFTWFWKTSGEGYSDAHNSLDFRTVAITMITPKGQRLRSWNIDRAFPVKWTGPSFAVSSTDVPTEELEIAHHGFKPDNL